MESLIRLKGVRNKLITIIFNKNIRIWKPYIILNKSDWIIKIVNWEVIEWFRQIIVFRKKVLRAIKFNIKFECRIK